MVSAMPGIWLLVLIQVATHTARLEGGAFFVDERSCMDYRATLSRPLLGQQAGDVVACAHFVFEPQQ